MNKYYAQMRMSNFRFILVFVKNKFLAWPSTNQEYIILKDM